MKRPINLTATDLAIVSWIAHNARRDGTKPWFTAVELDDTETAGRLHLTVGTYLNRLRGMQPHGAFKAEQRKPGPGGSRTRQLVILDEGHWLWGCAAGSCPCDCGCVPGAGCTCPRELLSWRGPGIDDIRAFEPAAKLANLLVQAAVDHKEPEHHFWDHAAVFVLAPCILAAAEVGQTLADAVQGADDAAQAFLTGTVPSDPVAVAGYNSDPFQKFPELTKESVAATVRSLVPAMLQLLGQP